MKVIKLIDAIPQMEPADWIFYKGAKWHSKGIRIASISQYSHVGMLGFRDNHLGERVPVLIDTVQWKGGRAVYLEGEVRRHPGQYVWFKTNPQNRWPEFSRQKAVDRMWEFTGTDYGWGSLAFASVIFLPGVRLFQKVDAFCVDDEATKDWAAPFCSMGVAIATEVGGVDPVHNLRHSMTTPGHLAQSLFADAMGALVP